MLNKDKKRDEIIWGEIINWEEINEKMFEIDGNIFLDLYRRRYFKEKRIFKSLIQIISITDIKIRGIGNKNATIVLEARIALKNCKISLIKEIISLIYLNRNDILEIYFNEKEDEETEIVIRI